MTTASFRNCQVNTILAHTSDFIARGNTGLEFLFDFQIAKKNSEVVIKSFNHIQKAYLSAFLFAWDDIKLTREKVSKKRVEAVAFINNIDNESVL